MMAGLSAPVRASVDVQAHHSIARPKVTPSHITSRREMLRRNDGAQLASGLGYLQTRPMADPHRSCNLLLPQFGRAILPSRDGRSVPIFDSCSAANAELLDGRAGVRKLGGVLSSFLPIPLSPRWARLQFSAEG